MSARLSELPGDSAAFTPTPPDHYNRGDIYNDACAYTPEGRRLGRLAEHPFQIPWQGWQRVLRRTAVEMISDRISLVAAGCAFYGTLALFPAISMLISVYGLLFDPVTVEPHLVVLVDLLPPSAYHLIEDRVHELVRRPQMALTVSLSLSSIIALWSAATGTKSILSALNVAYEERERRSFLQFQATAFGMTIVALLGAVLGLALLVGMPPALAFLGMTDGAALLLQAVSVLLLVIFVVASLSILYRFGPSRAAPRWQWVAPGALLATALWLLVSLLFSFYVGHLSSYDAMYGSIGAAVGMMMWFYVTVYVVLLGAELNAELELQTARDSTAGAEKPIGQRGAYVADHVARN